jgi:hypothetical protein
MIPETGRGDCGVGGGLCPECVVTHHLSEAYDTACDIAAKAHGRRALEKGAKVPHVPHVEVLSPQEQNLAFAAVRCPRCFGTGLVTAGGLTADCPECAPLQQAAPDGVGKVVNAAVNAALKIERAACAKIADDVANLAQARCSARQNDFGAVATAKNIADAIRAREP